MEHSDHRPRRHSHTIALLFVWMALAPVLPCGVLGAEFVWDDSCFELVGSRDWESCAPTSEPCMEGGVPGQLFQNNWNVQAACGICPAFPGGEDDARLLGPGVTLASTVAVSNLFIESGSLAIGTNASLTVGHSIENRGLLVVRGFSMVNNLTNVGAIEIDGGWLENNSPALSTGTMTLVSGRLRGSDLAVRGSFDWLGGTIGEGGSGIIQPGGVLTLNGPDRKRLFFCGFDNSGVVRCNSDAVVELDSAGVTNRANGIVEAAAGGVFLSTNTPLRSLLVNLGTFLKSGTNTVTRFDGVPMINRGLLHVRSGSLEVRQGANAGEIRIDSGASLTIAAGGDGFELEQGTVISGAGQINVLGPLWSSSGSMSVPSISLDGGSLGAAGRLRILDSLRWTSGRIVEGTIEILSGGELGLEGTGEMEMFGGVIENHGTIRWINQGRLTVQGILVNESDGVISLEGRGVFTDSVVVTNRGVLRTASTNLMQIDSPLVNEGIVEVTQGILRFGNANYSQMSGELRLAGGRIQLTGAALEEGRIVGSGMLEGAEAILRHRAGVIEPGSPIGVLACEGAYDADSPDASLHVEIAGRDQYDRFEVGTLAILQGPLRVTFRDGFVPQPGDTFDVMRYGGVIGTHRLLEVDGLPVHLKLVPIYGDNQLQLTVQQQSQQGITGIRVEGSEVVFSIPTVAGVSHQVEATRSLSPADWQLVQGISGDGLVQTVRIPTDGSAARFFRIRY